MSSWGCKAALGQGMASLPCRTPPPPPLPRSLNRSCAEQEAVTCKDHMPSHVTVSPTFKSTLRTVRLPCRHVLGWEDVGPGTSLGLSGALGVYPEHP